MPRIGTQTGSQKAQHKGRKKVKVRVAKHPKGVVAHRATGNYKGAVSHSRHPAREAKLYKPRPTKVLRKQSRQEQRHLQARIRAIRKPPKSEGILGKVEHAAADVGHLITHPSIP